MGGPLDCLAEVPLGVAEARRGDLDGVPVFAPRHVHLGQVIHRLADDRVDANRLVVDTEVNVEGEHRREGDEGRQTDHGGRATRPPVVARLLGTHAVPLGDLDDVFAGFAGVVGHEGLLTVG